VVHSAFPKDQASFILGSLLAVLTLFAVPTLLLGCVSPFVIRLSLADVKVAGNVAGSVYAVATVGSMFGAFAPVLWLLPTFGVRNTFGIVAASLMLTGIVGVMMAAAGGQARAASQQINT